MDCFTSNLLVREKWERFAPILFGCALAALGLKWLLLGNIWYAKIVPFYDSLSYQIHVENILREYQLNGWRIEPSLFFAGTTAFLYKVVVTVLAPVLPLSRTTLYVYLIPLHLIALAILFNFLYRKTNSLALAFLGPFLYLSTTPFRELIHGILDQRMDTATASFALMLWVVALDWAETPDSLKKTIFFGLVAGLALLHRPIIGVQASLAVMMLLMYAIWVGYRAGRVRAVPSRMGIVAVTAVVLFLPWFMFNARRFYTYYIVNGYDIGRLSLPEAISAYTGYFGHWLGTPLGILIGSLLIGALMLRTFSWKYFLLIAGLVILPLVPLVFSGSGNPPISQIALAGIGLLPLIFVPTNRFGIVASVAFTIVALGMAVWNLTILIRAVNKVDVKERQLAEEVILNLSKEFPINQRIYLSGFTVAGGGPVAFTSIARLDLGIPLYTGFSPYHALEFGLPSRETSFSEEELDHAAACALYRAYKRGGILMLVEPSQVEEFQPQLTWPFSHQLATRIDKLALESGRLEDIGVEAILNGIPVHFYSIKPGGGASTKGCNQ